MSNGTCFSFVRHWTHGNFAKVVIPEKTASAVTGMKKRSSIRMRKLRIVVLRPRREHGLTGIVTRVCRLVRVPDIVQGHLVFIMVVVTHAGSCEGEHEQREKLRLGDHFLES